MIVAETRRDLALWSERPERVDVADLGVAARDEAPGERVADLERRVQRRRRGEAQRDLFRSDPRRRAGWLVSERQVPSAAPVIVIRCQNRDRGPRNVAAKAGLRRHQADRERAHARPGARRPRCRPRRRRLAQPLTTFERDQPEHEQRPECEVQPCRLEVDYRDHPGLAGGAELRQNG